MKIFKRWTSGVVASFDWVAQQVENHEALVSSALREMNEGVAKAKIQLQRVQKDGSTLRSQLEAAREDERRWAERAVASAQEDKERAIECLRRKRRARDDISGLSQRLDAHIEVERQLSKDLDTLQKRLVELRQKKNSLLARKYTVEAQGATSLEQVSILHEIDDIFERWEVKLAMCEPVDVVSDTFARDFETKEELHDLEMELEALQGENR